MHSDRNSLTEGPIAKKILLFALPILLGNIFQQFYHAFDSWVVGKFIGDTALAAVFRKLLPAAPGYETLQLKDLSAEKTYTFSTVPQKLRIGQFGSLVKHVAPVDLNPNGMILRTADRHITLPDGTQELRSGGAALMAGIRLLPLFRGTGSDANQRTLTDFGSELFIIREVTDCDNT